MFLQHIDILDDTVFQEIRSSSAANPSLGPQFVNDLKISSTSAELFTSSSETFPWIEIKLNVPQTMTGVEFVNRADNQYLEYLAKVEVRAGMESVPDGLAGELLTMNTKVGYYEGPAGNAEVVQVMFDIPTRAQFITLQLAYGPAFLVLNEIKVLKDCTPLIKSIVDSKGHVEYPASFVFKDGVESMTPPNYWIADKQATGDEAFFIMDLGCPQNITGFRVKNAQNVAYTNSGVKKFTIFSSATSTGPWDSQYSAEVQDVRPKVNNLASISTGVYPLKCPIPSTQFIKFVVDEYYGIKATLKFFDIINSGTQNTLISFVTQNTWIGGLDCPAPDTGFEGMTGEEVTSSGDWQGCAEKCGEKDSCLGWTWAAGVCKLYDGYMNIVPLTGVTAGDGSCASKYGQAIHHAYVLTMQINTLTAPTEDTSFRV